jgi:M6 family metalloprotease-like protein
LKSTGTIRIGVVFVDFPDAVATRSTQSVFSLISPESERRYAAMSYGRAIYEFVPLQRWLRMSRASTTYSMSRSNTTFNTHRDFISEALNLSTGSLTVSDLDGFVVLANPDAIAFNFGPAFTPNDSFFAATAASRTWMNGATSGTDLLYWGSGWFNHEFGHAMGLVDLYAFSGEAHRFVGHFSLMGLINGGAPELFGWERWSLGWLSDSEVVCLNSGSATVDLEPISRAGGTKIAVAKLDSNRVLVVESRRRTGYDTGLSKEGVVAYVVNTAVGSGEGVIRVLPINDSDVTKMSVALGAGQSLNYENISVSVSSSGPNGDRVTIRFG